MDFLNTILQHKQAEITARKEQLSFQDLEAKLNEATSVRDFKRHFTPGTIGIIAEIKQASPSKGLLCQDFNPRRLAKAYEAAGASAISVLTDERFFKGSLADLRSAREVTTTVPLLRKDFIIDAYQLLEARVNGADAALLIVAALTENQLQQLIQAANRLQLTPLVEVHNQVELEIALAAGAAVIGINNRDLTTFNVDINTTFKLAKLIPNTVMIVSESGIRHHEDLTRLAEAGVQAVLIGEALVTEVDPGLKIRQLLGRVG